MLSPYMYITSLSTVNLIAGCFLHGSAIMVRFHQRQINKNIKKDAALVLGSKFMVNSFFLLQYCEIL